MAPRYRLTWSPEFRARARSIPAVLVALVAVAVLSHVATSQIAPNGDHDGDGLSDAAEIRLGTYLKFGNDADGDGILDVDEDVNRNGVVDPNETDPANPDTDGDGISDGLERAGQTVTTCSGTASIGSNDVDGDGLINALDRDSDNDRISDRDELSGSAYPAWTSVTSNPYAADTDGDGLTDDRELTWATSPCLANTDGDGWDDGVEVRLGSNPLVPDTDRDGIRDGTGTDSVETDPDQDGTINALDFDSDNDGLDDAQELSLGTDGSNFDTDGDGYGDGYEYHRRAAGFDPLVAGPDTDGDGLRDGVEIAWWKTDPYSADSDGDGIDDGDEGTTTTPQGHVLPADTDQDGLINALDRDSDNDGLTDRDENTIDRDPTQPGIQKTDPYRADSDGDGLSDGVEVNVFRTHPLRTDSDGDGWSDADELRTYQTDPLRRDTDGDGRPDNTGNENLEDSDGDGLPNVLDIDSDNDGLTDGQEDVDLDGVVDAGETSPISDDTDGDGLWDRYEQPDGSRTDPLRADTDGDGIGDREELLGLRFDVSSVVQITIATDPTRADTDGDGLADGLERDPSGTFWRSNPINPDTDGDGIRDGATIVVTYRKSDGSTATQTYVEGYEESEVVRDGIPNIRDANSDWNDAVSGDRDFRDRTEYAYRLLPGVLGPLNPGLVDTDGDGRSDAEEIRAGSDPLDAGSFQGSGNWDGQDPDGDGLYNDEEFILGLSQVLDSDGDGLYDGEELDPLGIDYEHNGTPGDDRDGRPQQWGTHPKLADTDGDTRSDGVELGANVALHGDPLLADSDGDGLPDALDGPGGANARTADTDGDGMLDGLEVARGVDPSVRDSDGDAVGCALMEDLGELYRWGTDPLSAVADADQDGLTDREEVCVAGTNPRLADTDFDLLADGSADEPDPRNRDFDGDLLVDGFEVTGEYRGDYAPLARGFSPSLVDSDTDGMADLAEAAMMLRVPDGAGYRLSDDTDGDGLMDGEEAPTPAGDAHRLELLVYQTRGSYFSNPNDVDTDGDGIPEGRNLDATHEPALGPLADVDEDGVNMAMDVDSDNDWIRDGAGEETFVHDLDGDAIPNVIDGDSYDNDRLVDPLEFHLFEVGQAQGDSDYDDDGLLDGNEYHHWFFNPIVESFGVLGGAPAAPNAVRVRGNPRLMDSDHDGLADGREAGLRAAQEPTSPTGPGVGGTLGTPSLDPEGTSNSHPGWWDTDRDGLADSIEDVDRDGVDADALAGGAETNPRSADSDRDGLLDGSENVKWTLNGRSGEPYSAADRSNPLAADTDGDGIWDGRESGLVQLESPLDPIPSAALDSGDRGKHTTSPKLADTDGDGLGDGVEDQNQDGVWSANESDPNNCDTDNDRLDDSRDAQRLDPRRGGADLDVATPGDPGRIALAGLDAATGSFRGASAVVEVANTTAADNPVAGDGPSGVASLPNVYAVVTDLAWIGEDPRSSYVSPEATTACRNIPRTALVVNSVACQTLDAGRTAYQVSVDAPSSTLPGTYQGTLYFVASADACRGITGCATPGSAVSTMAPYDSVVVTVVVPPVFNADILDVEANQAWGVGASNPADFYSGPAAANEMHLKGLIDHEGLLTGVFQISNPNGSVDANDDGRNDVNCQPALPRPKWDLAEPQGNTLLRTVRFRFEKTAGAPGVENAISFSKSLQDFGLGTLDEVVVQVQTLDLGQCGPGGRIEGNVIAWHDADGDGLRDAGDQDLDAFRLEIELVTPDLDISDHQGSLAGNKLFQKVEPNRQLENWTFRASSACDPALNGVLDSFDGPGCETWVHPELYNPGTSGRTAIVTGQCTEPDDGTPSRFQVFKYDPPTQSYDLTKSFLVKVWTCQSGRVPCGTSNEFFMKVDQSSIAADVPEGIYRPFWGQDRGHDNGYVILAVQGAATSFTREAIGYPVRYAGGTVNDPTFGYFDRFEVELELVKSDCPPNIANASIAIAVEPGQIRSGTSIVLGCIDQELTGLVATIGCLRGPAGEICNASVSVEDGTLPRDGRTTLTVTVDASNYAPGLYEGYAFLTSSNGLRDSVVVSVDINDYCPATIVNSELAIGPVAPQQTGTAISSVTGCAQALTLTASVGCLTRTDGRDQICDATVALDTETLDPTRGTVLRLAVPARDHLAGEYQGTVQVTTDHSRISSVPVRFTIQAVPNWTFNPARVDLSCDVENVAGRSRSVRIVNTGNTDLTLTGTATGLPLEAIASTPVSWRQEFDLTLTAACDGLVAGQQSGDVVIRNGDVTRILPVALDIAASPLAAVTPEVASAEPGQAARVRLAITNSGNVALLANDVTFRIGNFRPVDLPGGREIPFNREITLSRNVDRGSSDVLEVEVPVAAGFMCGAYEAEVITDVRSGDRSSRSNDVARINVLGCLNRPLAFSRNPIRLAQSRAVDIAFAEGGAVTAKIYTMRGQMVRSLATNVTLSANGRLSWDFKNDGGDVVATGVYLVVADIGGKQYREKLLVVK